MSTGEMEKTDYRDSEDASVDIPKKRFKSYFTWDFYEATRSYEVYVMVVWLGLVLCLHRAISPSDVLGLTDNFALVSVAMTWTPLFCISSEKKRARSLVSENTKALAAAIKEVFGSKQETSALGWDKIASKVNKKFYITGSGKPHIITSTGNNVRITSECTFRDECIRRKLQHMARKAACVPQ